MHFRPIAYCFVFAVLPLVAAPQYWPQRTVLKDQRSYTERHFAAELQGKMSGIDVIRSIPGSLSLSLTVDSSMSSLDIPADSVICAFTGRHYWFLIYQRGDSVYSARLGQGAVVDREMRVCNGHNLQLLDRTSSSFTLVSSDSLFLCQLPTDDSALQVLRLARNQRAPVYARLSDSIVVVASTLNSDIRSVERYSDGQWHSIGIVPARDGAITHSASAVYAVSVRAGHYVLHILSLHSNQQIPLSVDIPDDFFELTALGVQHDTCVVLFRNGVVRCTAQSVVSADHLPLHDIEAPTTVEFVANDIVAHSRHQMYRFGIVSDSWFRVRSMFGFFRRYGILVLLSLLVIFLLARMLRYRRQLRDVIELGSTGISFVVDKSMRLRRINSRARELFEMDTSTPLRRVLKYYCNGESQRIVESFVASALAVRGTQIQKLMFKNASGDQEIIFTAQPLRSMSGGFDGLVVSGVDITEELERKRLVNWAQLAHDMQTNLSIIKLNSEQLEGSVDVASEEKRLRIRHQASLLLQRVRDIVSIGRDEQLHLSENELRAVFHEVVREFDDSSFAHVRFLTPERLLLVKLDKAKMLRALRNVVENALRAIGQESGTIEFLALTTKTELVIGVKDSGKGMDEQTLANFFKPYYSNYRQYGGTGIGTMIMQRAIALHGGKIEVETAVGKGTTIYFKLPLALYVRG